MSEENETVTAIVTLEQIPVIKERIKITGENVRKRLAELNIDNLIANEDTVKSIKKLKTELNKEIKSFEDQRKEVKKAILKPYEEFNQVYEDEVKKKYDEAIKKLTDKQVQVETGMLDKKEADLKSYFTELCISDDIDFITFDKYKSLDSVKIQLSTTLKKYKEACNEFINRIKSDLELIDTQEYKVEILAEFKQTLNCSLSITAIVDRKKREQDEKDRVQKQEWIRRSKEITNLGFILDQSKTKYIHSKHEDLDIIWLDVSDIEKDDFKSKLDIVEVEIKSREPKIGPGKDEEKPLITEPKKEQQKKTVLKAPEVLEVKEESYIVEFRIHDTMENIKKLKTFMQENNINFKNI